MRKLCRLFATNKIVRTLVSSFVLILSLQSSSAIWAAKPTIDCSKIRGVCYVPTPNNEEEWRRELGYGKRVNLNAIRFWTSPKQYAISGDEYIPEVVHLVRVADECGYKSMPILFNGNMLNPETIESAAYPQADAFTTALVNALKDEPGLLMFDVMNEPLCSPYIGDAPENEQKERAEKIWTFLRREIALIQKLAPDVLTTVGYTTGWEIEESTARMIDVISFHDYTDRRQVMEDNIRLALDWGKRLDKQVINTETGCIARANPYDMVLECCLTHNVGWFAFELMIKGRCIDEHGIFYPDGTIRDAATIASMMGCFRNRNLKTVVPTNPNREGKVDHALALLRDALKEYTSDAFDYRRSDKKKLLDACEVASNILEGCELVPMSDLPSAHVQAFREDENADLWEIRKFAYGLAQRLKEVAQIF